MGGSVRISSIGSPSSVASCRRCVFGGDILLLADYFLARACADYGLPARALMPDARGRLVAYRWPGNVRELANVLERVALLSDTDEITAAMLDCLVGDPANPRRWARRLPPGHWTMRSAATSKPPSAPAAATFAAPPPPSASRAIRCARAWTSTACDSTRRGCARRRQTTHRTGRSRPSGSDATHLLPEGAHPRRGPARPWPAHPTLAHCAH